VLEEERILGYNGYDECEFKRGKARADPTCDSDEDQDDDTDEGYDTVDSQQSRMKMKMKMNMKTTTTSIAHSSSSSTPMPTPAPMSKQRKRNKKTKAVKEDSESNSQHASDNIIDIDARIKQHVPLQYTNHVINRLHKCIFSGKDVYYTLIDLFFFITSATVDVDNKLFTVYTTLRLIFWKLTILMS
jgi:hypothetical protein